jgi:hypothetical protein
LRLKYFVCVAAANTAFRVTLVFEVNIYPL